MNNEVNKTKKIPFFEVKITDNPEEGVKSISLDFEKNQPIECYKIAQLYNYNIGTVIDALWHNDLQKAAKYVQFELDRDIDVEYWVNFKGTGLDMYFDDLKLNFPKNIYSALYIIYGGYNKKKLLICLEYIKNEIKTLSE